MLDHEKHDEPIKDVVIDKNKYLGPARILHPAPANGPIPEYPNHSKRRLSNDESNLLTRKADTSMTDPHTTANNNSDEEKDG